MKTASLSHCEATYQVLAACLPAVRKQSDALRHPEQGRPPEAGPPQAERPDEGSEILRPNLPPPGSKLGLRMTDWPPRNDGEV